MGQNTVSTPNTKGTLFVDPSVARNTLRSSTRHGARFFSGRPGSGFSPPAIVPNITRRVNRSLCVHCRVPANRRRRLRMVVSTLSHCGFLRALAYDMSWFVRCRRWKPNTRRRNLRCAVRNSETCSLPSIHVTHPYSRVSITSALPCATSERTGQRPYRTAPAGIDCSSMPMRVGPAVRSLA